jgi:hypothetical protein
LLNGVLWREATWRLRCKQETYNGETKLRVSIVTVALKLDYVGESRLLASQLGL